MSQAHKTAALRLIPPKQWNKMCMGLSSLTAMIECCHSWKHMLFQLERRFFCNASCRSKLRPGCPTVMSSSWQWIWTTSCSRDHFSISRRDMDEPTWEHWCLLPEKSCQIVKWTCIGVVGARTCPRIQAVEWSTWKRQDKDVESSNVSSLTCWPPIQKQL